MILHSVTLIVEFPHLFNFDVTNVLGCLFFSFPHFSQLPCLRVVLVLLLNLPSSVLYAVTIMFADNKSSEETILIR